MARETISMSDDEVRDFLSRQRWVVLVTLNEQGSPTAELVPSTLENDTLYFGVASGGEAEANIGRDPRVCCANDEYPTYYAIKGVTARGRARAAAAAGERLGWEVDGLSAFGLDLGDVLSFDFGKIEHKLGA